MRKITEIKQLVAEGTITAEEVYAEVSERATLRQSMVGNLYPHMLSDEERLLTLVGSALSLPEVYVMPSGWGKHQYIAGEVYKVYFMQDRGYAQPDGSYGPRSRARRFTKVEVLERLQEEGSEWQDPAMNFYDICSWIKNNWTGVQSAEEAALNFINYQLALELQDMPTKDLAQYIGSGILPAEPKFVDEWCDGQEDTDAICKHLVEYFG